MPDLPHDTALLFLDPDQGVWSVPTGLAVSEREVSKGRRVQVVHRDDDVCREAVQLQLAACGQDEAEACLSLNFDDADQVFVVVVLDQQKPTLLKLHRLPSSIRLHLRAA
jgi:hypothetical protein